MKLGRSCLLRGDEARTDPDSSGAITAGVCGVSTRYKVFKQTRTTGRLRRRGHLQYHQRLHKARARPSEETCTAGCNGCSVADLELPLVYIPEVDDSRNEDAERSVTRVAASFSTLCADDVDAALNCLFYMLQYIM